MRRRLSLRGRMVVTAVVATAVVLAVLLAWASPTLERRARDDAFATLTAQAWLMGRVAEEALARGASDDELDSQVDAAAGEVDARVTIIATDGRVLADSALSGAQLRAVENHGHRPEVLGARNTIAAPTAPRIPPKRWPRSASRFVPIAPGSELATESPSRNASSSIHRRRVTTRWRTRCAIA